LEGKSSSLSVMSDIYRMRGDYDRAESLLRQSLALVQQLGHLEGLATNLKNLGTIAQIRGDTATALAHYQNALVTFEQLGMPRETQQVRGLIAGLEGGSASSPDPVRQLSAQARAAAQAGRAEEAVSAQEQAVVLARARAGEMEAGGEAGRGAHREALVTLSVLLYNLAMYYQGADRHDEAVAALEEVVALDERTGHPDLESDRQALEQARALAAMSPQEREALAATASRADEIESDIEAQLAGLAPEERAQAEAAAREFLQRWEAMSEEEQAAYWAQAEAAGRREQIESLADQARDGALAALRGEVDRDALIRELEQVAWQAAEGEEPGSPSTPLRAGPWDELAAYLRAVAALLRGEPLPPVPAQYAGHIAALREAME
jgi:hypothetical protein